MQRRARCGHALGKGGAVLLSHGQRVLGAAATVGGGEHHGAAHRRLPAHAHVPHAPAAAGGQAVAARRRQGGLYQRPEQDVHGDSRLLEGGALALLHHVLERRLRLPAAVRCGGQPRVVRLRAAVHQPGALPGPGARRVHARGAGAHILHDQPRGGPGAGEEGAHQGWRRRGRAGARPGERLRGQVPDCQGPHPQDAQVDKVQRHAAVRAQLVVCVKLWYAREQDKATTVVCERRRCTRPPAPLTVDARRRTAYVRHVGALPNAMPSRKAGAVIA
mmetsp:Transcript_16507/g.56141  ORF Transcript_16507/g.56141 Transcript_16507/m.56141 type:complete len:275 (-) Transcript_16507:1522-2346(-)